MAEVQEAILVVEDDDVFQEQIHRLLGDRCRLIMAPDGRKAMEALTTDQPACVLLDFQLPDATGLQLLPKFIEQKLAVVMLTAEGNESVAVKAMKLGCHDYLVKRELNRDLLSRTINKAIERNSLRQALATQRIELEAFVATAAHDIKAPLRHIDRFSDLAIHAASEGNLKATAENLQWVKRSVQRLAGMVDALLEYTRLDGSQNRFDAVDLNKQVKPLIIEFEQALSECDGRIVVQSLPVVFGDAHLLTQLLQNLIANSIKFRDERPPVISISAEQNGDNWIISVSDNGIGIDAKHHQQIFKPLSRLHSESKYEGYGIGLATCQRIVEKHHGEIWVNPQADEGCTICFSLEQPDRAT